MDKYNVTGMTCAACSSRVEKVVSKVEGVTHVQVNLLTNTMTVQGEVPSSDVIEAVEKAGYGAALIVSEKNDDRREVTIAGVSANNKKNINSETTVIAKRLCASVIVLLPLMYLSMGHMMWGWPVTKFLDGNHFGITLTQLLLTTIVMIINQRFFISGTKAALHGAPNMDTLVALGSGTSYGFSIFETYAMTLEVKNGELSNVHSHMHNLYFESAAMILTLITVGKLLESYSKGRTTDAIKGLMNLAPKTATLIDECSGEDCGTIERVVPIEQVKVGDLFAVKPGESIPVDGILVDGNSAVDESALTGESIPVDKQIGDKVSAGTINTMGYMVCRATRVGDDTTISQIIQMVSDAAATKAPIAKIADKVSGVFVPTVLIIAFITLTGWIIAGQTFGYALTRAVSVLVISCPCALGLATPVAIMVGNGVGARHGILFKNAVALENAGKSDIIVFDKTGTLTEGKPTVVDIFPSNDSNIEELISFGAAIEQKSEHPLAKAVVSYAENYGGRIEEIKVQEFSIDPGNGLKGKTLNGENVYGGNERYISRFVNIPPELISKAGEYAEKGNTPVYFALERKILGMIVIADVLKADAVEAVSQLRQMGKYVVMLTGDNERTAKAVGKVAGVDEVISNVLPQDKSAQIGRLMEQGKVVMVGDGINDAPALTRADVGIAIGAGTDIAMDAADIILVKSRISDVTAAIKLSQRVMYNIYENLFWAFFYNIIGIPLAAGIFVKVFGWSLNPMFGAMAMSLSSFCVVTNALRLNLVKLGPGKTNDTKMELNAEGIADKMLLEGNVKKMNLDANDEQMNLERNDEGIHIKENEKTNIKENKNMTKTLKIEGMMCGHCEAHMSKALNAMDGVEAKVDQKSGTAVVITEKDYTFDDYKAVVEEAGYSLISME